MTNTIVWTLLIGGVATLAIACFILGEKTAEARQAWRRVATVSGWRGGRRVVRGHVLEVKPSPLGKGQHTAYVDGKHIGIYQTREICELVAEAELRRQEALKPASAISTVQLEEATAVAWVQPVTFLPRDKKRQEPRHFGIGVGSTAEG